MYIGVYVKMRFETWSLFFFLSFWFMWFVRWLKYFVYIKRSVSCKMITSQKVPSGAHIKGFFHNKTIISQNVSFEAQVNNVFISQESYILFSRYLSFCIFNQICDVMMSISTWDRVHFLIYLLNHNFLSHQTWPAFRYKQVQ